MEDILELNMFPTFLSFTERHPRYVALIGFSFFVMGVTLYGFQYISERTAVTPLIEGRESIVEMQESSSVPTRTDFGTTTPDDFLAEIPLEGGVLFEQSYSLEYPDQKQLSVVFPSILTIQENYALYEDFFKNQRWNIVNTYESDAVSSLYAMKENNHINVTITAERVSISVTETKYGN